MRQSNLNRNLCKNILDRASDSTFRNASVNLFFVYVFATSDGQKPDGPRASPSQSQWATARPGSSQLLSPSILDQE